MVIFYTQAQYSGEKIDVLYQITQIKSECWYSNDVFYFKIPECHQAKVGEIYVLSGSVADSTDKSVFGKKRLIITQKESIAPGKGSLNDWKSRLVRWKNHIWAKLRQPVIENLPYPHSLVLLSMIYGQQEEMDDQTQELFRLTGTTHLQAVSGYNFTVIVAGILSLVEKLAKKRAQGICILAAAVLFTYLVGIQPSVIRAVATLIIILATRFFLMRQNNSTFSMCFVLYFMLFWKPLWLFSIGFQLSVAAVVGIVYFQPIFQHYFEVLIHIHTATTGKQAKIPPFIADIASGFTTSVAASITTAPVLLFHFHELSLTGIVISSLFASILNSIVLLGFWTTIAASIVYSPLMKPVILIWTKLVLYLPLEFFLSSIEWFSKVQILSITTEDFSWWLALGWYLVLFFIWKFNRARTNSSISRGRLFV